MHTVALPYYCCACYGQIKVAVMVNEWWRRIFDLFSDGSNHSLDELYQVFIDFAVISVMAVIVGVAATGFTRIYTLMWRESLTFSDLALWRKTNLRIEGASQRLQEDVHRAVKVVESIGWTIASTLMTLVAFIPILWTLSLNIYIPHLSYIPGSLLWVSFAGSGIGIVISWILGGKLPDIENDSQRIEANFRKVLIYGEVPKNRARDAFEAALRRIFYDLKSNVYRLMWHNLYFDVWRFSFGKGMDFLPLLLMGPSVLVGLLTIGELVQAINAFGQVANNLSVFIHNWGMITEIRSIRKRLGEFEKCLDKYTSAAETKTNTSIEAVGEAEIPPEAAGD